MYILDIYILKKVQCVQSSQINGYYACRLCFGSEGQSAPPCHHDRCIIDFYTPFVKKMQKSHHNLGDLCVFSRLQSITWLVVNLKACTGSE